MSKIKYLVYIPANLKFWWKSGAYFCAVDDHSADVSMSEVESSSQEEEERGD